MFKQFASVLGLTLLLFTLTAFAAPCANGDKYGSTYIADIPGGQVRLGINEVNRKLVVGFFMGGQAFGFTGGDSVVYGPHKLTASSNTFGGAKVSLKTMQLYVLNVNDKEAIFQVDLGGRSMTLEARIEKLATEKVAGAPVGTLKYVKAASMFRTDETGVACYFPVIGGGTPDYSDPRCVNMTTDDHWWLCFRCCAFSPYASQSTICNLQV